MTTPENEENSVPEDHEDSELTVAEQNESATDDTQGIAPGPESAGSPEPEAEPEAETSPEPQPAPSAGTPQQSEQAAPGVGTPVGAELGSEAATGSGLEPEGVSEDQSTGKRKRKKRLPWPLRLLFGIVKTIAALLGLIVVAVGVFVMIAVITHTDPLNALPDGFDAYARIDSVSTMIQSTLDLEIADVILATPELAAIRGQITDLRSQPFIRSPLFQFLSNIRIDAALYQQNEFLLVGDLGFRSALTRMTFPLFPLVNRLKDLDIQFTDDGNLGYFIIPGDDNTAIYVAVKKNICAVSNNLALVESSMTFEKRRVDNQALTEALKQPSEGDLRVLVKPETFLASARDADNSLSTMLNQLKFPDFAALDIKVSNENLFLSVALPVSSDVPVLSKMIDGRSAAPAIVSLLPASTQFSSILAAGTPEELKDLAATMLGPEFTKTLDQANQGAQVALGMDLDQLVFSWTGSELGAFGLETYPEPVFFIRIMDEKKRQEIFDKAFSSLIMKENSSTVVDNIRVSQITFPWFIRSVLNALNVELPAPYFAQADDFLFFSESPEVLISTLTQIKDKQYLVRTDSWQQSGAKVPASAAVEIFYSLDRSIPFFLQGKGPVVEALLRYGRGIATINFDGGTLRVTLAAQALEGKGVRMAPGFPVKTEGKQSTPTYTLSRSGKSALLYWIESSTTLVEYDPSTGTRTTAQLDDKSWILPDPNGSNSTVWVVSDRGVVYRFAPGLKATPKFPVITGQEPSAGPSLLGHKLVIPTQDGPSLMIVSFDGSVQTDFYSLEADVLAPVSTVNGYIAAYPKSFTSSFVVIDQQGETIPGWPIPAEGISFGSPVFIPQDNGFSVCFLTQAGGLYIYGKGGMNDPSSHYELPDVFYSQPVWAPEAQALFCVGESGTIYKVSLDGDIDTAHPHGLKGKDAVITAKDVTGDAAEEVFVSESAAAVYGLASQLTLLDGFPIGGGRVPSFGDLNGDGRLEIVTGGFDNQVRAYSFNK